MMYKYFTKIIIVVFLWGKDNFGDLIFKKKIFNNLPTKFSILPLNLYSDNNISSINDQLNLYIYTKMNL